MNFSYHREYDNEDLEWSGATGLSLSTSPATDTVGHGYDANDAVLPPPSQSFDTDFNGHFDIKNEVPILAPRPHIPIGRLKQTIPSSSTRYSKREIAFPTPFTIYPNMFSNYDGSTTGSASFRPFTYAYAPEPEPYIQTGWKRYTHPEGLIYYYHPQHRVLTDANLQAPFIYTKLNEWMSEILQIRDTCPSFDISRSYEIVLELYPDFTCGYYVADNDRQMILFFDRADTAELGLPDVVSMEHLKLQLHRQYWKHLEYFPAHRPAPRLAQDGLKAILSHAWADGITSDLSTSPYSPEVCQEFLQILNNLTRIRTPEQVVYRTCIIGRLMDEFTQARFINLYGEAEAVRLANNQSIFPACEPPSESGHSGSQSRSFSFSMIYEIVVIMLLRQPEIELERLKSIWVDKIAYTVSWRRFIRERIEGWRNVLIISFGFTLIDTILVLALRTYANTPIWSSHYPQVMAYQLALMSLLLNICSTIVGLVAISVHAPHHNSTASNAASYFTNVWHKTHGFKPLSIALSLPRALATWAVAGTSLSIVMLSLESLSLPTLLFSCAFTLSLTALLGWAIMFFYAHPSGPRGLSWRG